MQDKTKNKTEPSLLSTPTTSYVSIQNLQNNNDVAKNRSDRESYHYEDDDSIVTIVTTITVTHSTTDSHSIYRYPTSFCPFNNMCTIL